MPEFVWKIIIAFGILSDHDRLSGATVGFILKSDHRYPGQYVKKGKEESSGWPPLTKHREQ